MSSRRREPFNTFCASYDFSLAPAPVAGEILSIGGYFSILCRSTAHFAQFVDDCPVLVRLLKGR